LVSEIPDSPQRSPRIEAIRDALLDGIASEEEMAAALDVPVTIIRKWSLPFFVIGGRFRYHSIAAGRKRLLTQLAEAEASTAA
jgi:hypothetical protein